MVRHAASVQLLVLLSPLLLAACGQGATADRMLAQQPIAVVTPGNDVGPAPTLALDQPAGLAASSGPRFTNDNWAAVIAAPDANQGATVSIVGRVFNIEQDQTREAVQLWTDSVHQAGNTVVVFQKAGAPTVKKEDMVRADGVLDSAFDGKSDSGEVLHLPRVQASKITLLGPNGAEPSISSVGVAAGVSGAASAPASPTTVSTPAPAPRATRTPAPLLLGLYRVVSSAPTGLNVRVGPAIGQIKLGVLHDGELVRVISSPPRSSYVQVTGDGFNGYVAAVYLSGPVQIANPTLGKLSPR